MKKIAFSFVLILCVIISFSQSDTLFLQKNKKVACKIIEINEFEIKYRSAENLDGPIYIIDKSTVNRYKLSNGFTELFIPDELSIENEHKEILSNRQVIKINPFSFAFNHISFAYESVIKVGMNLDVEAGYINSEINPEVSTLFKSGLNNSIHNSGMYFKPGIKFFLGEDFSIKGLKYAHPLKGRYIKLDLAVSYINFQDLSHVYSSYYNNYSVATQTVYSNMNAVAYGGFVNYGRQFILGNILTLDYYAGVGFTGQSITYSNPNFFTNPFPNAQNNYYNYGNDKNNTSNYYGFLRVPTLGLSFTAGFRIGYIIPHKDTKKTHINKN